MKTDIRETFPSADDVRSGREKQLNELADNALVAIRGLLRERIPLQYDVTRVTPDRRDKEDTIKIIISFLQSKGFTVKRENGSCQRERDSWDYLLIS